MGKLGEPNPFCIIPFVFTVILYKVKIFARGVVAYFLTRGQTIGSGYSRIYHHHISKTVDTSVNQAFLSLYNLDRTRAGVELFKPSFNKMFSKGKVFVGWDKRILQKGNYFYGFSHISFDEIKLPEKTFSFTVLRDPANRVVSYYNKMLLALKRDANYHPIYQRHGKWLGSSFSDFLKNIPKLNIRLEPFHVRKSNVKVGVSNSDSSRLKFMLKDEYLLYNLLKKEWKR